MRCPDEMRLSVRDLVRMGADVIATRKDRIQAVYHDGVRVV